MRERHAEHRVARLQTRHEDRHVGLRAGVRLHVGVLRAEELLHALDRQRSRRRRRTRSRRNSACRDSLRRTCWSSRRPSLRAPPRWRSSPTRSARGSLVLAAVFVFDGDEDLVIDMATIVCGVRMSTTVVSSIGGRCGYDRRRRVVRLRRGQRFRLAEAEDLHADEAAVAISATPPRIERGGCDATRARWTCQRERRRLTARFGLRHLP